MEKQQVTYKGKPICLTADVSAEILQATKEWQEPPLWQRSLAGHSSEGYEELDMTEATLCA